MRAILRLGLALAMRFITGSEYERISYYPRGDPVSLTIQSLYNVYIYFNAGASNWPCGRRAGTPRLAPSSLRPLWADQTSSAPIAAPHASDPRAPSASEPSRLAWRPASCGHHRTRTVPVLPRASSRSLWSSPCTAVGK